MNERIRELIEQAGINWVVPTVGTLEYPSKGEVDHLKKFAELIVRECAGVCNDARDSTDFVTIAGITDYCAKTIMKRFGVEE